MAFELAQTLVSEFKDMLQITMEGKVAAFYESEKSLQQVPNYPAVFVLCPSFDIVEWHTDYLDATYQLMIGCIVLEQDTEQLRRKLYSLMRDIVESIFDFEEASNYTYQKRERFRVNFGPVFTSGNDAFVADAQIMIPVKRKLAELR